MSDTFETKRLPAAADVVALDGSNVRVLPSLAGGSMAHFELAPGQVSRAAQHRTVGEIWYFLSGSGEMWRRQGELEQTVTVERGVCVTIPVGTRFQFRGAGNEPLSAVAVTMPPWPGEDEAMFVPGKWQPSVP